MWWGVVSFPERSWEEPSFFSSFGVTPRPHQWGIPIAFSGYNMWIVYHFVYLKVVRRFDRGVLHHWNTNLAHKERRVYVSFFFSDFILASWISKSSSLPFLNHIDANNSQFRLTLLPNDVNTSLEFDSYRKEIESEATANMKRSHSLGSAQKRALIVKRLIPLVISLMILGGAVAARFLIPLP